MDDLLTTRQLQELLQVDRITIYRMLGDGRLRGFKVGGQWRFARQEIETWLHVQQGSPEAFQITDQPGDRMVPSHQALSLSCVQAIQDVCAEALDIAQVTIDLEGKPLSEISNSNAFCDLILSTDEGLRRCSASWKTLGNGQARTCHAGLLCVTARIEVDNQLIAITAGCQFAHQRGKPDLPKLATELGLSVTDLEDAIDSIREVSDEYQGRISRLLHQVAGTFSEIGEERMKLLSRLRHIAEVSQI